MASDYNQLFLQLILEAFPGNVYWKDSSGKFLQCNEQQAIQFGFSSSKDVIGKYDHQVIPAKEAQKIREVEDQIIASRQPQIIEETVSLPDGSEATFISQKAPIYSLDGVPVGIIGISIDVTSKKLLEKTIQDKEKAQNMAEHLRLGAGAIAHELRTPLACVALSSKLIENHLKKLAEKYDISESDTAFFAKNFAAIVHSAKFAGKFIDITLSNLKSSSGFEDVECNVCNLTSVLNSSIEEYPFSSNQKEKIHISAPNETWFYGNEILMQNVFNNLIKNALYYIAEVSKGEIFIDIESTKNKNIIRFKDTSKGVSKEVLPKLFDNFFSQRSSGTGLGLAFCKKVIERFGGNISADSIEGEFLEFQISLPRPSDL